MPKVVEVPGVGNVEFPDSMDDQAISAALRKQTGAQQQQPQAQQPGGVQPSALSRFFSSLGAMINPVPAIEEYMNRPNQWKAVADVLGTQRGTPEEAAALERGMQVPLTNPMGYTPPVNTEPVLQAGMEAAQGNLAGAAGTLAGGYGIPAAAAPILSRVGNPLQNRNPAKAAAIQYAQEQGIPVPAGAATGNKMIRGAEALAGSSPIGSVISGIQESRAAKGLQRVAGELADEAYPNPVIAETAGEGMLGYLERSASESARQADTHYQSVRDVQADPKYTQNVITKMKRDPKTGRSTPVYEDVPLPVDIREVQSALRPIEKEMSQFWAPSERSSSAGYAAIKSILEENYNVPLSLAERGLGGIKELAREGAPASAGVAKFIIPKLQKLIDDAAAKAGPDVVNSLQAGRQMTSKQKATEAVRKSIAGNLEEPVGAFEKMTTRNDTSIKRLRELAEEAPDEIPKVGRAYIEELVDTATQEGGFTRAKSVYNKWQKLGPETKKILFKNPQHIQDLDNFFLAQKEIAETPNPSGTAVVGQLVPLAYNAVRGDIAGSLGYTLGTGAAAALLYSPRGVRLLTRALKVPSNTKVGASLLGQIREMAERERGKNPEPESAP
jgi:hypothetical protein